MKRKLFININYNYNYKYCIFQGRIMSIPEWRMFLINTSRNTFLILAVKSILVKNIKY